MHGPPFRLPDSWALCSLDEVLERLESGSRPKGGVRGYSEGVPSIGGEHLDGNGGFRFDSVRFVPENFYQGMTKGKIKGSDILVVKDGATTGKTSLVALDFPYSRAVINEHVFILRGRSEVIDQHYLFHFLSSIQGQNQIRGKFQGSAQGGINSTFVRHFPIPLPPLSEQHRIVSKIQELFQELKIARETLQKVPSLTWKFRYSVLAAAFGGKLTERDPGDESVKKLLARLRKEHGKSFNASSGTKGKDCIELVSPEPVNGEKSEELPAGWEWVAVGELTQSTFYGPRFAKNEYGKSGVVTIRTTDIDGMGNIRLSNPPRIFLSEQDINHFGLKNGDLLVTRSGSIGKCAVFEGIGEPAIPGAYLIRFRLFKDLVSPRYLLAYLLSWKGQKLLSRNATSVTQANINAEVIKRLAIPLAPVAEQQRIVLKMNELFSRAAQTEKAVQEAISCAGSLQESILSRAFRGELVPQDPNDEPASILLERIKARRSISKREIFSGNNVGNLVKR